MKRIAGVIWIAGWLAGCDGAGEAASPVDAGSRVDAAEPAPDAGPRPDAAIPPGAFVRLTPPVIRVGESALLEWSVSQDAAYCRILQGLGGVPNTGSARVAPTRTMRYTLDCPGGPAGGVAITATLTVSDADPADPCGTQGGYFYLSSNDAWPIPRSALPRRGHLSPSFDQVNPTAVCAITCDAPWLSARVVDGSQAPALPAVLGPNANLELTIADPGAAAGGRCHFTTSGGDDDFAVAVTD